MMFLAAFRVDMRHHHLICLRSRWPASTSHGVLALYCQVEVNKLREALVSSEGSQKAASPAKSTTSSKYKPPAAALSASGKGMSLTPHNKIVPTAFRDRS